MKDLDSSQVLKLLDLTHLLYLQLSVGELVEVLKDHLDNGVSREAIIETILVFLDAVESKGTFNKHYIEVLEDLVAAMEGMCHSSFVLHPGYKGGEK